MLRKRATKEQVEANIKKRRAIGIKRAQAELRNQENLARQQREEGLKERQREIKRKRLESEARVSAARAKKSEQGSRLIKARKTQVKTFLGLSTKPHHGKHKGGGW